MIRSMKDQGLSISEILRRLGLSRTTVRRNLKYRKVPTYQMDPTCPVIEPFLPLVRELMKRYSKPRVMFYLDPPYLSSGKKYRHSFTVDDLRDLKKCMDCHAGSCPLNLSSFDEGREEIFGKPDRVIDFANPLDGNRKNRWGCGYWWKF